MIRAAEIDWLYGLQHFGIKLGLHNIRALLGVLEHPESAYPSVLIAGTNGKGSVGAMMHAVLTAAGSKVGLFTSPHLVRPNERIRIGEQDIGTADLCDRLGRIRERIEEALARGEMEAHPSFFEVITATALVTFAEERVDAALLEVGLGGRLDATNAVDADLAVIVSVDLDHTKSLGATPEQIAFEKAGVIKRGKPVVSGVVRQQAVSVLRRIAAEREAPLTDANFAVRLVEDKPDGLTLETSRRRYPRLSPSLAGRHQVHNARVALAASELFAERVGARLDERAVRDGLASVRWRGRLEWIRGDRDRPEMLLDGAHNPAGTRTLAAYLRTLAGPAPVVLFGAMHGKLLPEMLASLAGVARGLVITRPSVRRAADPHDVAAIAREHFDSVEVVPQVEAALDRAAALARHRGFVLVTGSLYLVGEVLGLFEGHPSPGPIPM